MQKLALLQEGIMKVRRSIVAAGAAIVLATTGALALPALASVHNASTTLKFTAVTNNAVAFTSSTGGSQETDVNSTGKTIGFDVVYFTVKGNSATVNAAFDIKGGLLYGTVTTTNGGKTFTGKVTGGTGKFKGATGTITAKTLPRHKTAITIVYS
jgi:hypothetical protein